MVLRKGISGLILSLVFVGSLAAQSEFEAGKSSYKRGDYNNAKKSFIQALDKDSENREVAFYLGITYAQLEMHDIAVRTLKAATKLSKSESEKNDRYKRPKKISKMVGLFSDLDRKDKVQGSVGVVAFVNKEGTVVFAYPFKKLNDAMTESAVKSTYKLKFEPATMNGERVVAFQQIVYYLSLV